MSESITLHVEGMKCSGCEQNLTTALSAVEGVNQVKASHAEKNVIIDYDAGRLSPETLEKAIEQAGFTVIR